MYFPLTYRSETYLKYLPDEIYDIIWKIVEMDEYLDNCRKKEFSIKNEINNRQLLITHFNIKYDFWEKYMGCFECIKVSDIETIIWCHHCMCGFCSKNCFDSDNHFCYKRGLISYNHFR